MSGYGYSGPVRILDSAASATDSAWVALADYEIASLILDITTSGTIEIWGSNADGVQTAPTDDVQLGSDITTAGATLFDFDGQPRTKFFRVRHTAGATAATADFHGSNH